MICLLALPILAILGLFSATHRKLASEAFDCVFRRITLRKCESGLDTRLKSSITSTIMRRSPKTAGFVFKHFELLSWIFIAMFLVSSYFAIQGTYNYAVYGNCNGKDSTEFCIFNPLGTQEPANNSNCTTASCDQEACDCDNCKGTECTEACNKGA